MENKKKTGKKVGILTFHCADNLGALLQAYGLLHWLKEADFEAFIVNYVPIFLRGREWFFPYMPASSLYKRIDLLLWGTKRNLKLGFSWFLRKKKMSQFRNQYLTKDPKIYSTKALSQVKADILIVGSDQIWNPNITDGFQPAYFGAFRNDHIQKVIAYGASFGSGFLALEREKEFSFLLSFVQEISMREKTAAKYIEERFQRQVSHVFDPVFLLEKSQWLALKEMPKEENYIFCYETEYSKPLREAAYQLAKREGLKIIGLSMEKNDWSLSAFAIGPKEFLGYIFKAKYVFTNSFHGLAFSILFHKPFYVYRHSSVGTRIEDLLESLYLTKHLASPNYSFNIHEEIDWNNVDRLLEIYKKKSIEFLNQSLLKT